VTHYITFVGLTKYWKGNLQQEKPAMQTATPKPTTSGHAEHHGPVIAFRVAVESL